MEEGGSHVSAHETERDLIIFDHVTKHVFFLSCYIKTISKVNGLIHRHGNRIRNNMSFANLALTLVTPIRIREIFPLTVCRCAIKKAMQCSKTM